MQPELSSINSKSHFPFWKKVTMILLFFTIAPVALIASVISLTSVSTKTEVKTQPVKLGYNNYSKQGVQVFASLPQEFPSIGGEVIGSDSRVEIIRMYLDANNSELEPYAQLLVDQADQFNLDYRLLTAIAQKESGLCNVIPEGSHNCWGWGIHSRGTLYFDSYEEAITTISKGLKDNYADLGYVTVAEIMQKWIPHSPGGVWADDVLAYMNNIE
jgi:hypothetical protein